MSGLRRKRPSSSTSSMRRQSPSSSSTRRRKSTHSTATIDFGLNAIHQKKNPNDDEIIDSDDESSIQSNDMDGKDSDGDDDDDDRDDEEKETVEEKRIRLAKQYLAKMKQAELEDEHSSDDDNSSDGDSSDDDERAHIDHDHKLDESEKLSKRLERERLKKQGILERLLAKKIKTSIHQKWDTIMDKVQQHQSNPQSQAKAWVQHNQYKLCRGHDLTPTCVALHVPSGSVAYSASKDNSIIMWDIETQSKLQTIVQKWNPKKCDYTRNSGEVLAMAASDDGRFLAVGGRDATVKIYDVRQKRLATTTAADNKNTSDSPNSDFEIRGIATTFEGHKGPVTALAFRSKSLQLFSGSNDRCIRHYNLQELAYIETLYGHQAPVTGISCYGARQEVPFSVGRDRTARAWKISEETHLIFRGGAKLSSADCISSIKDDWFLTGHDDGVLNLWTMTKKKAAGTEMSAHGCYGNNQSGIPRGICCVDSIRGSDLAVTGSNDGYLRFWNVSLFLYLFISYESHRTLISMMSFFYMNCFRLRYQLEIKAKREVSIQLGKYHWMDS